MPLVIVTHRLNECVKLQKERDVHVLIASLEITKEGERISRDLPSDTSEFRCLTNSIPPLSTTANYQRYFNLAIVLNRTDEWTDLVSCSGISGFTEITGVINQRVLFSIILNWSNWKNLYRCSVQVYKKYEDTAIGPNSLSDWVSLSLSLPPWWVGWSKENKSGI